MKKRISLNKQRFVNEFDYVLLKVKFAFDPFVLVHCHKIMKMSFVKYDSFNKGKFSWFNKSH